MSDLSQRHTLYIRYMTRSAGTAHSRWRGRARTASAAGSASHPARRRRGRCRPARAARCTRRLAGSRAAAAPDWRQRGSSRPPTPPARGRSRCRSNSSPQLPERGGETRASKSGCHPCRTSCLTAAGDSYCWCDLTCSVLRPAASGSSSHRLAPSRPAAPPLACGGAARGELGRWASTGGRRPAACEAAAHLTAAGRRSDSA